MLGLGMIVVSLELAVTIRVCVSFVAPEVIPFRFTVWLVASSPIVSGLIGSNVGGSLTGLTVTVKVRCTTLFEPAPSLTVTVTVVDPKALLTEVNVNVPVVFGLV